MTPLKMVIVGLGIVFAVVVLWALVESIVLRIRLKRAADDSRRRLLAGSLSSARKDREPSNSKEVRP